MPVNRPIPVRFAAPCCETCEQYRADAAVIDAADIPRRQWVEVGTGAPAVMADGLPFLSPFDAGPDARLGSYGQ